MIFSNLAPLCRNGIAWERNWRLDQPYTVILNKMDLQEGWFTYSNSKFMTKYPSEKSWAMTTHGSCTWLRQNHKYRAQRGTPKHVDFWNDPQIDVLNPFCQLIQFTKFVSKKKVSWPWTNISNTHNFAPYMFWRPSRSESEPTWSQLGLDKKNLKPIKPTKQP